MTALTTLQAVLQTGIHSARPAANAVGSGSLYACSTHGLIYQWDGSVWSTWATLGSAGAAAAIGARATRITSNATISASTWTALGLNGEDWDSGTLHDTATN